MLGARRLAPVVIRRAEAAAAAAGGIPSKLSLTLTCPHKSIFDGEAVDQVTIPGSGGVFGVLPGHVPVVAELKAGVVSVIKGSETTDLFVSSGFAFVNPDSSAEVLAIEAVGLDEIDPAAVKAE